MKQSDQTWVAWIIEADCQTTDHQAISDLAQEMSDYFHENEVQTTHFEWSMSAKQDKVIVHERYASSEGALKHIDAFGNRFAARFSSLLQPKRVVVLGHPSQPLLEILTGMNPEVMHTFTGFSR